MDDTLLVIDLSCLEVAQYIMGNQVLNVRRDGCNYKGFCHTWHYSPCYVREGLHIDNTT